MSRLLYEVYHSKYFPRFFYTKPDGGNASGVTAYFLIEWKILFSIGVLKFSPGTREAYHNHAFNAFTWWITGEAHELRKFDGGFDVNIYHRGWKPKYTPRDNLHKVIAITESWCFTIRGPWLDTWYELRDGVKVCLTHGRKIVESP